MPRANRYIQPGHIYHITHRCHNREFLLNCPEDRIEYCSRMRNALRKHRISLFDYCVTCNHIHLLCICDRRGDLSRFMQQLAGGFADSYNLRNNRTGSVWGGRYHATMVESGEHLLNGLRYLDLNMVRAGVVRHPSEWLWCGYLELTGGCKRSQMLDIDRLVMLLGLSDRATLADLHKSRISEAILSGGLERVGIWTESIAVGSQSFVSAIASGNRMRKRMKIAMAHDGAWYVKEDHGIYVPCIY